MGSPFGDNPPSLPLVGTTYYLEWRIMDGLARLAEAERDIVRSVLKHQDQENYTLMAYVIMDDRVKVVAKPQMGHELGDIVQGWMFLSAMLVQKERNKQGSLWEVRYTDRELRNDNELREALQHIMDTHRQRWSDTANYKWVEYIPDE